MLCIGAAPLSAGDAIEKDAAAIIAGTSALCQATTSCQTVMVNQSCDEAVRTTTQLCTQTATIEVSDQIETMPNCQHLVVSDSAVAGGSYLGPWYPCTSDGSQCQGAYLVAGAVNGMWAGIH